MCHEHRYERNGISNADKYHGEGGETERPRYKDSVVEAQQSKLARDSCNRPGPGG